MTKKRWRRVQKLFEQALACAPEERAMFLSRSCGGDAALQADVESLLCHNEQAAGDFMKTPEPHEFDFRELPETVSLSRSTPPDPALVPIAGYEYVREIGEGGQGQVYLARDVRHGQALREVALKVLRRTADSQAEAEERFLHESKILAALDHPNIVKLWEKDKSEDCCYYAMEYVEGCSLDDYVSSQNPTTYQRLALFRGVCAAVSYCHQQAVIHRDLKSANIRVNSDGRPYLIDFGLAKQAGAVFDPYGQPMGTVFHMAPEQTGGDPRRIDVRTDVYALGVMLYRLMTGSHPYPVHQLQYPEDAEEIFRHVRETAPDTEALSRARVDREVRAIILKCLAKEKEHRYQSASELLADLDAYFSATPLHHTAAPGRVYRARRRLKWITAKYHSTAVGGLALLVCLVAFAWSQVESTPGGWGWVTFPERSFGMLAAAGARTLNPNVWLDEVVVVAITDKCNSRVAELAARHACPDVVPGNLLSYRPLHGVLMKRLARARPRAVVWDYWFKDEHAADDAFVAGVRALREQDAIVTLGVFFLNDDGSPWVSGPILRSVNGWGLLMAKKRKAASPDIALVAKPATRPLVPTVALATFALINRPGAHGVIEWNGENLWLDVEYDRPANGDAAGDAWLPYTDRIALTAIDVGEADALRKDDHAHGVSRPATTGRVELEPMDVITDDDQWRWATRTVKTGLYRLELPAQDELDEHTVFYYDAMTADDEQLERWFAGRIVVIGDARVKDRRKPDWVEMGPEYRNGHVFGVYFIAESIAALMDAHHIGRPSRWVQFGWCLVATVVGALVGRRFPGRRGRVSRYVVNVLLTIGCVVLAVAIYVQSRYLTPPTSMALALWLGAGASSWITAAKDEWARRAAMLGQALRLPPAA